MILIFIGICYAKTIQILIVPTLKTQIMHTHKKKENVFENILTIFSLTRSIQDKTNHWNALALTKPTWITDGMAQTLTQNSHMIWQGSPAMNSWQRANCSSSICYCWQYDIHCTNTVPTNFVSNESIMGEKKKDCICTQYSPLLLNEAQPEEEHHGEGEDPEHLEEVLLELRDTQILIDKPKPFH